MSVSASATTTTSTATLLASGPSDTNSESDVLIYNESDATVYLGGSDVTTAIGFPVASGGTVGVVLRFRDELYGIVASGSKSVRVLETRA